MRFLVAGLLVYLSTTIVPAGHVGVQDFFGSISDRILAPGINVSLDVSLLFGLQPEAAARVYRTIGRHFEGVVIDPQLRSIIRDVSAESEAKFLYLGSRELVAQNMFKHVRAALAPRGIEAEQVLLLSGRKRNASAWRLRASPTSRRSSRGDQRRASEVEGHRGRPRAVQKPNTKIVVLGDKSGLPIILSDK